MNPATDVRLSVGASRHRRTPLRTRPAFRAVLALAALASLVAAPLAAGQDAGAGQGTDVALRPVPTPAPESFAYRIESVPFGAEVTLVTRAGVRRRLGTTPLDLRLAAPLDGDLVFALDGYGEVRRPVGSGAARIVRADLERIAGREAAAPAVERVTWRPSRWWVDGLAVAVAVGATAVAVDQKTRADRLYATYRETGDPALRVPMRRHDTRAYVAYGLGTAGLGVFAVRLALRR